MYLVKTAELINGTDRHVLKRVAVREKSLLDEVRREVEVMVGPSSPCVTTAGQQLHHKAGTHDLELIYVLLVPAETSSRSPEHCEPD